MGHLQRGRRDRARARRRALGGVWIAEGVLAYLPADAQVRLIERVRTLAAPGSTITLDRIVGDPVVGNRPVDADAEQLQSGEPPWLDTLFVTAALPA